jgi:hypothetical protein
MRGGGSEEVTWQNQQGDLGSLLHLNSHLAGASKAQYVCKPASAVCHPIISRNYSTTQGPCKLAYLLCAISFEPHNQPHATHYTWGIASFDSPVIWRIVTVWKHHGHCAASPKLPTSTLKAADTLLNDRLEIRVEKGGPLSIAIKWAGENGRWGQWRWTYGR